MRVDLFDYDLPEDRIAQRPTAARDGGRMLVVDPADEGPATLTDSSVLELPRWLPSRALLVVNDTRVMPARLLAKRPGTGGRVEIFLVEREDLQGDAASNGSRNEREQSSQVSQVWAAMARSSKPLRIDEVLQVGEGLEARILGRAARQNDGAAPLFRVRLTSNGALAEALDRVGHVPLPPYIRRDDDEADRERYQTIFAKEPGAIAAPTAGLHLSQALVVKLAKAGVEIATVTLHVGLGTFAPVRVDDFDEHPMHEESFALSADTAAAITAARSEGRAVVAVGTTVVRAIESAARRSRDGGDATAPISAARPLDPCEGKTRLLLQPGEKLLAVDGLLTNFHLPKSTLLALVATFTGVENLHRAYEHAIAAGYRFYSYGDAMLVLRALGSPRREMPSDAKPEKEHGGAAAVRSPG